MSRLLLRGGRVIDPASGMDEVADIALEKGRVVKVGSGPDSSIADRVVDADGLIVTPGLIDPHVHLREPGQEHKETIETGCEAGAAGGFTTLCCMPNTTPALDLPSLLSAVIHSAEGKACRVFPVGAATMGRKGEQITEIELLKRAGAVGISDDGDVVESPAMMRRVLMACADAGLVFMQHAQEPSLTRGACMHAGTVSTKLGLTGWPRIAEELIVERDIRLAAMTGARYHVQHISAAGSVELIGDARERGLPVSGEASPHHLPLTHEACEGFDTSAKMNPPLREQSDADALREGVASGAITVLATDHAPHSADEKAMPFEQAPFGIVGLETALPLYIESLVDSGAIGWPRLVELLTVEPARLCNLGREARADNGLGEIFEGGPADITVIDPSESWTVTPESFCGKSTNSPFIGRELRGRAVMTIVGGQIRLDRLSARAGV